MYLNRSKVRIPPCYQKNRTSYAYTRLQVRSRVHVPTKDCAIYASLRQNSENVQLSNGLGPGNIHRLTYQYNGKELTFVIENSKTAVTFIYESPIGTNYSHLCAKSFSKLWVRDDVNEHYEWFHFHQTIRGRRQVVYMYKHIPSGKKVTFMFRKSRS